MKQFTLVMAVVASLSLGDIPHAAAFDYSQLLPSCVFDDLPQAIRGQNKTWPTKVYCLYGEDVELALPSGEHVFNDVDGQLLMQIENNNEYFVVSAFPNGGERPQPEQLASAVISGLQDNIAEQGGRLGLPKYSQRGSLDVVEVVAHIPYSGGKIYIKSVFFLSDTNIYSLVATYFGSPSPNVKRFLDAFRLQE